MFEREKWVGPHPERDEYGLRPQYTSRPQGHQLRGEAAELGVLQHRAAQVLRGYFRCEKEYVAFFAEKPGFQHVPAHVVQKPAGLAPACLATGIFGLLDVPAAAVLPPDEVAALCQVPRAEFAVAAAER